MGILAAMQSASVDLRRRQSPARLLLVSALLCLHGICAQADTGKLRLTGGVSTIEGAAGGGLSPWALIGSNATAGKIGASAYVTRTRTHDYGLTSYGVAVGWNERVEVSLAHQDFDAAAAVLLNGIAPFGVRPGQHIRMDVVGLKLRLRPCTGTSSLADPRQTARPRARRKRRLPPSIMTLRPVTAHCSCPMEKPHAARCR